MEQKCKMCGKNTNGYKCVQCGEEAHAHDPNHSCGGAYCIPKCEKCGKAEEKCDPATCTPE